MISRRLKAIREITCIITGVLIMSFRKYNVFIILAKGFSYSSVKYNSTSRLDGEVNQPTQLCLL